MSEEQAVSVYQEGKTIYLDKFKELPDDIRKRLSCYQLDQIFEKMVMPAIQSVRQLDRRGRCESSASPAGYGAWLSMSTAPKHYGSRVILLCPSIHEKETPLIGEAFLGNDGLWYWAGADVGYHDPIIDGNVPPTHWMPLPVAS